MPKIKKFGKGRNRASISQYQRWQRTRNLILEEHSYSGRSDQTSGVNLPATTSEQSYFPTNVEDINEERCSVNEGVNIADESYQNIEIHDMQYDTVEISLEPQQSINQDTQNHVPHPTSDLHEFSFISQEEYESVMAHRLDTEQDKTEPLSVLQGHRIVDLGFVLNWALPLQQQHSKKCTLGKLSLVKETRNGLTSVLTFQCNECYQNIEKCTEKPGETKSKLNFGAVWGTLSTGSTYTHLKELLGVMDIPCMSYRLFHSIEMQLGETWQDDIFKSMEEAGKEEKELAIQAGQRDTDGTPWTMVFIDGGWSHRSYGHSYNASSGVGVIIGKLTGKILFLGVRNKYCTVCSRASNKQQPPVQHVCFKNWTSSSSAMEASIIVEGFRISENMHGLRYLQFTADGDSSVYAKIRSDVPYGNYVTKIECRNHAVKNYGKALFNIKKDTKVTAEGRKLLTVSKIKELQDISTKLIYLNALNDVEQLKNDLKNGPFHVFGDHTKCHESYCTTVGIGNTGKTSMEIVKKSGLYFHINSSLERLISKSHRLISNETNNRAELYMSILCKFQAGKRLNLTGRGSFNTRSIMSGLRYNEGVEWQSKQWKNLFNSSPGQNFKKFISANKRSLELKAKRSLQFDSTKKTCSSNKMVPVTNKEKNVDYGPDAIQPELVDEEYNSERARILQSLKVTDEDIIKIERDTVGQWDNYEYRMHRRYRLTASRFGAVCKRRPTTSCANLVKTFIAPSSFDNEYTSYGKEKESVARQRFASLHPDMELKESGMFIDQIHHHLACTPDGLVDNDGIIEIKCLLKVHKSGKTLMEAVTSMKNLPVHLINGKLVLKRNHDYYFQVSDNKETSIHQFLIIVWFMRTNFSF